MKGEKGVFSDGAACCPHKSCRGPSSSALWRDKWKRLPALYSAVKEAGAEEISKKISVMELKCRI